MTGCGRTDRGVHASHYVAHFDAHKELDNLLYRLNKMLPDAVIVHECKLFRKTSMLGMLPDGEPISITYRIRKSLYLPLSLGSTFDQWNWTSIEEGSRCF